MTTRQYFIPNWGYQNETAKRQNQVANEGFLNDTTQSASVLSITGSAAVSFVGKSLYKASFSISGVATISFVDASVVRAVLSVTGAASVSFTGLIKAQVKSYFLPNWGYVNETIPRQFNIANWGYFNDTQLVGNHYAITGQSSVAFAGAHASPAAFSVTGNSSVSFAGKFNYRAAFSIQGHSVFSALGLFGQSGIFSIAGQAQVAFAGGYGFSTDVSYFNMDDLGSYLSFSSYLPSASIVNFHGVSNLNIVGAYKFSSSFNIQGQSAVAFTGQIGPASSGGQFDYSNAANSGLLPGVMI